MIEAALTALAVGPTVYWFIIMTVGFVVMLVFTIRIFFTYVWNAIRHGKGEAVEAVERLIR
jgi:hypothetical protein